MLCLQLHVLDVETLQRFSRKTGLLPTLGSLFAQYFRRSPHEAAAIDLVKILGSRLKSVTPQDTETFLSIRSSVAP